LVTKIDTYPNFHQSQDEYDCVEYEEEEEDCEEEEEVKKPTEDEDCEEEDETPAPAPPKTTAAAPTASTTTAKAYVPSYPSAVPASNANTNTTKNNIVSQSGAFSMKSVNYVSMFVAGALAALVL
jgi:FtsZ-interacting cell division protein YlmF